MSKDSYEYREVHEKLKRISPELTKIWAVLGPEVPSCFNCQGCSFEWNDALSILREAANSEDDLTQRSLRPYMDIIAEAFSDIHLRIECIRGHLANTNNAVSEELKIMQARFDFMKKNELAVKRMRDNGFYMLLCIDGCPFDGSEHESAEQAVDFAINSKKE